MVQDYHKDFAMYSEQDRKILKEFVGPVVGTAVVPSAAGRKQGEGS